MKKYRAWAEINLKNLADNIRHLKEKVGPDVKVMAVVKADAYGHGSMPVSRAALANGAYMIGVGDSSEAIELRRNGITEPILVLGAVIEEEIGWMVSYNITPTVHSMNLLGQFNTEARRQNTKFKIHLKIDTGMSRLGSTPKRAIEIMRKLPTFKNITLEGVCSHLSCASDHNEEAFTNKQINIFKETVKKAESETNIKVPLEHIANTGAIMCNHNGYNDCFNMVRVGGLMYGIDPGNLREISQDFNPVLTLKSQIAFLRKAPKKTPVGYNRTFIKKSSWIATIPIGYNDGYPYQLSNKGFVIIRGQKVPVVGTVTMDYIMVDVTAIPTFDIGDEVILIGKPPESETRITVEELAQLAGVTPYVITCGLGKRVNRMYIKNETAQPPVENIP